MTEPAVVCTQVVKVYRGATEEVQAIRGVDLTIPRGSLTATAYAVYSGAVAVSARHRLGPLAIRSRTPDGIAAVTGAAGVAMAVAGMRRFGSGRQVSGASHPMLITDGVYAFGRNPEYVGASRHLPDAALGRCR